MNRWTELKYITHSELTEINTLQSMWGSNGWRKHVSRELVRNYDLEKERQKLL